MLQNIRDNSQGIVAKVIVAFIVLTFAIFGLESITGGGSGNQVAVVNGQDISQQELYQAVQMRRQQMMRDMGESFDPTMLDQNLLEQQSLKGLIDQALLLQQAESLGLYFPDSAVDQLIVDTESFQVDGVFSPDQFQLALRSVGLTPVQFRRMIQGEMLINQLNAGFSVSNFITPTELEALSRLERQARDVRYITLSAEEARATVSVDAEESRSYYDANPAEFLADEKVKVDYLLLDKNDLLDEVTVSEDEIVFAYENLIAQLKDSASNDRRAAHILLEVNEENPDEQVLVLARELKTRLDAGEDFAALAKEYSADSFSAAQGGDLGTVEEGFLGDAFDDALDSLQTGAVSDPVKSDFGYQLVKRLPSEQVEISELADVREQLIREIKLNSIEPVFVERSQLLADVSFESADLNQPAEELDLSKQSTALFGREGGVEGLATNPRFVAAAFADDVLSDGVNSQLIELDGDRVAILRIAEHIKPEPQPFSDVQEIIEQVLLAVKAEEMLHERALKLREEALSGGLDSVNDVTWSETETVTRQQPGDLPQQLLLDAYKAPRPANDRPSIVISGLPSGDKVLLAVTAVSVPEADKAEEELRNQFLSRMLAQQQGQMMFDEYRKSLQQTAEIETF